MVRDRKAAVAEVAAAGVLVGVGSFTVDRLLVLILVASASLWLRGHSWAAIGLQGGPCVRRSVVRGVAMAVAILILSRSAIVPFASWATGQAVDLSGLIAPGDTRGLVLRLIEAWTMAAVGEELVFRGYLIQRLLDIFGDWPLGVALAVVGAGVLFGLAHSYQGWAGVIATGLIGMLLGAFYVGVGRSLWPLVVCHAAVDTVGLVMMFVDQRWVLVP